MKKVQSRGRGDWGRGDWGRGDEGPYLAASSIDCHRAPPLMGPGAASSPLCCRKHGLMRRAPGPCSLPFCTSGLSAPGCTPRE